MDPKRDLEGAQTVIAQLKKQLEQSHHQLEKETALRKLLKQEHEDSSQKVRQLQTQLEAVRGESSVISSADSWTQLQVLKDRNEHLSSTLAQTEAELQKLRLSQARSEAANSAKMAAQSAILVERLSSVQREREKALAAQLRVALHEKEEALKKVQQLEVWSGTQDKPNEKTLQGLVDNLSGAKSVHELKDVGAALLEKVKTFKEDNRQSILEKFQHLMAEKDAAFVKKQGLEAEIARLQRQLEMTETEYKLVDKTRVKALQAQLQAAIKEKETWQQKADKLEDTCETLRVLSSLQRSLTKEEEIKRKYELELQKCHAEKAAFMDQVEQALQERNLAVQERNLVIQERNALALQAQQEYERAERFQRLVLVLRKKAMGGPSTG